MALDRLNSPVVVAFDDHNSTWLRPRGRLDLGGRHRSLAEVVRMGLPSSSSPGMDAVTDLSPARIRRRTTVSFAPQPDIALFHVGSPPCVLGP